MSKRWLWWCTVVYAALLGVVVWSTFAARDRAVEQLSKPQSIASWQAWREDVRHDQASPGPVQRRVPKSGEPPALVLMRDYFAVTLFGAVLFSTLLFWMIAWFLIGTFLARK